QATAHQRVRASPLARRMARESGIDLHAIAGSGPGGRIVKADLLRAGDGARGASATAPVAREPLSAAASAAPASAGVPDRAGAKGTATEVELTRTQQTIARRMAESRATIPDFTLQMDVDMEECVRLRSELKRLGHGDDGGASAIPTYNDMVVKASALALR